MRREEKVTGPKTVTSTKKGEDDDCTLTSTMVTGLNTLTRTRRGQEDYYRAEDTNKH